MNTNFCMLICKCQTFICSAHYYLNKRTFHNLHITVCLDNSFMVYVIFIRVYLQLSLLRFHCDTKLKNSVKYHEFDAIY